MTGANETVCHVTHLPLDQIDCDPGQPRKFFGDEDGLISSKLHEKERLPQWIVAALWWSASAAVLEIPVADLSALISDWKRRFLSAALWLDFTGEKKPS